MKLVFPPPPAGIPPVTTIKSPALASSRATNVWDAVAIISSVDRQSGTITGVAPQTRASCLATDSLGVNATMG